MDFNTLTSRKSIQYIEQQFQSFVKVKSWEHDYYDKSGVVILENNKILSYSFIENEWKVYSSIKKLFESHTGWYNINEVQCHYEKALLKALNGSLLNHYYEYVYTNSLYGPFSILNKINNKIK
jgi:hypothetical protein